MNNFKHKPFCIHSSSPHRPLFAKADNFLGFFAHDNKTWSYKKQ